MSDHLNALKQLLDASEIVADSARFLTDQRRRYTGTADLVVQPASVQSVQTIMRFCSENRIPVTPQGGNTGLCGAAVPNGGILLNLSRLNRIRSINLADNAITAEAGCILKNVQDAAEQADRLFPLSLASEGSCQIGGNIACNAGGLNVLRYGSMRDLVLGLEIVLPDGELVEHLAPLHKNTTGYDLRHLFIGSEGTLGIITAATLKLFPLPQSSATAWIGLPDIASAVNLLSLLQSRFAERLTSYELISHFALSLSAEYSNITPPTEAPWHILAELTDPLPNQDLNTVLAEYLYENGFENAVLTRSEAERSNLWTLRENISAAQRHLGTSIKHDIALPIIHIPQFIEHCAHSLQAGYPDIQIVVFGHLGDGSLHYNTFLPSILSNQAYQYEEAINTIVYRHVLEAEGTIAAEHGIGQIKNQWLPEMRSETEINLMRAIKSQLDPHNILNPGKLLP